MLMAAGLVVPADAQFQKYRISIPGKASDRPYDIISMGSEGLALVRDLEKYGQGNKKWQVDLLDTTLVTFWTKELELDSRLHLVGFEHLSGRLYLLFRESQTTYLNFQLATLDFRQQSVQLDKVRFDLNFQLTHFTVAGTTALFGGYINSEAAVLLFDHTSDHPKVLPGMFTKDLSLLDLRTNINNSFNVLLLEKRRAGHQVLLVRTFDPNGNLLIDDEISIDSRFTILSGITSQLVHEEMLIAGTYGSGNSNDALGIYSVAVDPFREQPVAYADLGSISHYLDYLPEKKAQKVHEKIQKEKSSGKVPHYKANLLPIKMAEVGKSYFLFAETFHPPSNVTYYPYGNPAWNSLYYPYATPGYPYRPSAFDNPYYTQANRNAEVKMIESLVVRFRSPSSTPDGVTLTFDDVRRPILDQTSDFIIRKDSVILAYKFKSDIFYQHESEDPFSRPVPVKMAVQLAQPMDILKDEEDEGGLRFWYGQHFYAWGYRRVRATLGDEVESRYEFYVNRLDY